MKIAYFNLLSFCLTLIYITLNQHIINKLNQYMIKGANSRLKRCWLLPHTQVHSFYPKIFQNRWVHDKSSEGKL